jgi:hypothetical protein
MDRAVGLHYSGPASLTVLVHLMLLMSKVCRGVLSSIKPAAQHGVRYSCSSLTVHMRVTSGSPGTALLHCSLIVH